MIRRSITAVLASAIFVDAQMADHLPNVSNLYIVVFGKIGEDLIAPRNSITVRSSADVAAARAIFQHPQNVVVRDRNGHARLCSFGERVCVGVSDIVARHQAHILGIRIHALNLDE